MSNNIFHDRIQCVRSGYLYKTMRMVPLLFVFLSLLFLNPPLGRAEEGRESEHGFERIVYSYGGIANATTYSTLEKSVKQWTRELGQRQTKIDKEIEEIVQWLKARPVTNVSGEEWSQEKDAWLKKTRQLFKLMAELDFRKSEAERLEKIIEKYLGTPVYRLVEIFPNAGPGIFSRTDTSLYSLHIREFPLEVIPGSPFSFLVEAKQRMRWETEHSCYDSRDKDFKGQNDRRLKFSFAGPSPLTIEVAGEKQFAPLCEYAPSRKKTFEAQMISSRDGPVMITTKIQAPFELDDGVSLQVRLQINKFPEENYYPFHGNASGSGDIVKVDGLDGTGKIFNQFLADSKGFCSTPIEAGLAPSIAFDIGGIKLIYRHVRPGEPYITSLPAYQHPSDFNTPPFVGELKKTIALAELRGKSASFAKEWLTKRELKASLRPGSPAPSAELSGAVEKHDPPAGSEVALGSTVVLTIHSPYVSKMVEVPDLRGKPRKVAKQMLVDLGLEVLLRPGNPASSPQESDTIQDQKPFAGTTVEPGTAVTINVHPQYVEVKTIPKVVGLTTSQARSALADAGISNNTVILRPGAPAPSLDLSGKVESQEPAAGSTVGTDTKITLRVHSNFIDQFPIPNVVGLSSSKAKEKLRAKGFEVQLRPGSPATRQSDTGKVAAQQPDAGTMAKKGSQVTLKIFSPYVAKTLSDNEVCARDYPGSIAKGRGGNGRINCDCPAGRVWNNGQTKCITPQQPPPRSRVPDLTGSWNGGANVITREGNTYVVRGYNYNEYSRRQGWQNGNKRMEIYIDTYKSGLLDTFTGKILLRNNNSGRFFWQDCEGTYSKSAAYGSQPAEENITCRFGDAVSAVDKISRPLR